MEMVELKSPLELLTPSYLEFLSEMRSLGEKIDPDMFPRDTESISDFIQNILLAEKTSAQGSVPETTYWACVGDIVVGRISLRHYLNENLQEYGGHIGYDVRPSYRKKGIGKEMLRQLIGTDKAKEIGKLLLTCAPNNTASNKTILANGGVLAKTAYVEKWKRETNYYWITV
ncbi:MAG: GNAT family N-acetyltransferase [Bdellovibrionota bacterium]